MLDGFVVPHAQFRVFHGNPAADSTHTASRDQFPLICAPLRAEKAQTDLHLREFAQLEAQVKALQQQASANHTNSEKASTNPHAIADVVSGGLAECFMFYSRLMTVESFTWPDFLATVFTKLAEHFVSSANESVRNAILKVFQQSKAHVAQVNDPAKLIAHLSPLLISSSARTRAFTLQLLETMPALIQNDTAVHSQLVLSLDAENSEERVAALAATRSVLPLSSALQATIINLVLGSANRKDAAVLSLLEFAASDSAEAQQAWNHCGILYHDLVDDRSAIHCLRAMTSLASSHPETLLASHVQLIRHVIGKDPRKIVQNCALLSIRDLISSDQVSLDASSGVLECIQEQIRKPDGHSRLKLSALTVLERWSRTYELEERLASEVIEDVQQLCQLKYERFGSVGAKILANVVQQALVHETFDAAADLSLARYPLSMIQQLLELLHPSYFLESSSVWLSTLECVEKLCREFPEILAEWVVSCLVELVSLLNEQNTPGVKKHIATALSRMTSQRVEGAEKHTRLLLHELASVAPGDNSSRAALAATLFGILRDTSGDSNNAEEIDDLESILTNAPYASQADRYEVARLAMIHGYFRLALALVTSVSATVDKECFGGWLLSLRALCDAEASVVLDSRVGMDSVYQLSRAKTYLKAATGSRYGFEFQHQVVDLRMAWMQLVLQAQQFAGEAEYCNTKGASREAALSARFRDVASQYRALRATLLGASAADLDMLSTHGRISDLLATAIDGFLLHHPINSIILARQPDRPVEPSSISETCEALEADVCGKIEVLQRVDASRRAALGGKVLQQLLKTICSLPFGLSQQFFRMTMKEERRLSSNVQFLTFAENSAFTSKPRSRSQLGVAFGTDFNSVLKGVLAVHNSSRGFWEKTIDSIDVEVMVCLADKPAAFASMKLESERDNDVQERIHAQIPVDWKSQVAANESASASLYLPFEVSVHVKAEILRVKGSFQLLARVAVVDRNGEKWPLASTGCTRGFIVY